MSMRMRLTTRLGRLADAMGPASPGSAEVNIGEAGPAVRWGDRAEACMPEPSAALVEALEDACPVSVIWHDHATGVTSGDWLAGESPTAMTPEAAADVRALLLDCAMGDRQREALESARHIVIQKYTTEGPDR